MGQLLASLILKVLFLKNVAVLWQIQGHEVMAKATKSSLAKIRTWNAASVTSCL